MDKSFDTGRVLFQENRRTNERTHDLMQERTHECINTHEQAHERMH